MRITITPATRKWLAEVFNITLGVLIALALGQVADDLRWRFETQAARDALSNELGEAVGQAMVRVRLGGCTERRLQQLSTVLDTVEGTGRLPALGPISRPPYYTWTSDIWNSTQNAETASHLSRDQQSGYAGVYAFVRALDGFNAQEAQTWTRLGMMTGPGRRISPAELADLRHALADAVFYNRIITLDGARSVQVVAAYDLPADRRIARASLSRDFRTHPLCRAMPRYDPALPDAMSIGQLLRTVTADPITRPDPR